ncbi:Phosphate regulon transcriptional regulatory protein PhoB [bioreactor metagenome]|jgi:DNA-binding response OmpR family regulator|uniref:Phosphate regulon transcriptional regulatory protein PhoB n=1 Tax=bioreactor metagenome TaxID=1076179 RepID=A0A644WEN5_9ZZZZ|nr:response regulator transcription factor [Paludibacter sp.]
MKILIIEDENGMRETLETFFVQQKFVVETAHDFDSGLSKLSVYDYDCILLDITLPGGSGLDLLTEMKRMNKRDSVIIISARDAIDDKVLGLELGADDYLPKPFHLAELNARVKSLIRRNQSGGDMNVIIENVKLTPDKRTVFVNDEELLLNRKEFDLLYYFMANPNRLLNKTTLTEAVWGDNIDQADDLEFLYSQVKNLRRKLKTAGAVIEIKAVYGFGYKLISE